MTFRLKLRGFAPYARSLTVPRCHSDGPSPFDTYDTYLQLFCLVKPFILNFFLNTCLNS